MRALSFEFPRKSLIFLRTYLFPKNLSDRLIFVPSRPAGNGKQKLIHDHFLGTRPRIQCNTCPFKAKTNFVNFDSNIGVWVLFSNNSKSY